MTGINSNMPKSLLQPSHRDRPVNIDWPVGQRLHSAPMKLPMIAPRTDPASARCQSARYVSISKAVIDGLHISAGDRPKTGDRKQNRRLRVDIVKPDRKRIFAVRLDA